MKEAVSRTIEYAKARRRGKVLTRIAMYAPDEATRQRAADILLSPPMLVYSEGFVNPSDLGDYQAHTIPVHGNPHEVIRPLHDGIEL